MERNMFDDMESILLILMGLSTIYIVFSIAQFSLLSLRPKHFPPGPPALPFIGNVHRFASSKPFLKFTELRKDYGDVVGLKAGPSNIIVLNSPDVCRELLEKRGSIYSGRPNDYIVREHIVRDSQHILFTPMDGYHKHCRTVIRSLLGPSNAEQVAPLQNATAAFLMYNLISTPTRFHNHLRNWGLGTPLTAICGHRGAQTDDNLSRLFYDNQKNWLEFLTPGSAPPVEMFPILKYVPKAFAKWKGGAKDLRMKQRAWYYMMLNTAKEEIKTDTVRVDHRPAPYESLMASLLRQQTDKGGFSDDQLAYVGGALLDAAVDTTYSSALTFIKVLGAYPAILKRAQTEVDTLCGSQRPLQPQDLANLQYLRACWFEVSLHFTKTRSAPYGLTIAPTDTALATRSRRQLASRLRCRRHIPQLAFTQRDSSTPKHMGHLA
jgi:cytochrome P450